MLIRMEFVQRRSRHLRRQNSKPFRLGELALTLVEGVKRIWPQSKRARHMEKIERPRAEFRAMTLSKDQSLLPNLRT